MSAGKPLSISEFAKKEIPDQKTRARFLGVVLGIRLGHRAERIINDFNLTKDDIVWSLIEKYQATRYLHVATEFAEREISDPVTKEIFLELAPELTISFNLSIIEQRKDLDKNHPVWPLLAKYLMELLE